MDDRRLLDLARRDPGLARERLVAAMGGRIRRLAAHWLGDEAEDGVQDAFREIFRSLPRYRGEAAVSTWCYRIAMNTIIDHRKRSDRRTARERSSADLGVELSEEAATAFAESPFHTAAKRERDAQVHAALHSLPDIFREVLTLRSFEGLSYAEIAAVLGVPLGTVKSRMAAASVKLAACLAGTARTETGVDG